MIRFDDNLERIRPVSTFDSNFKFPYDVPMLFPYWSNIDRKYSFCSSPQNCFFDYANRSAVFYRNYTEDSNLPNASSILNRASQDVRTYAGSSFSYFSATWVLVVTWVRLRPEEIFEGDVKEGEVSPRKIQQTSTGTRSLN